MKKDGLKLNPKLLAPVIFGAWLFGCAHYIVVEIPPKVDLTSYPLIGIVEFTSNSTEKLNQSATQQFMKYIQKAQSRVRFLELGTQDDLLKTVNRKKLDPEAIQAVGKKYNVSSIFTGDFEISEIKPKINLSQGLSSVNASATVNVSMASKHLDTTTGATIWTNSRHGEWPVAKVNKGSGNPLSINLSAPEDKYDQFIGDLAFAVTDDFQVHYEKRKAPEK